MQKMENAKQAFKGDLEKLRALPLGNETAVGGWGIIDAPTGAQDAVVVTQEGTCIFTGRGNRLDAANARKVFQALVEGEAASLKSEAQHRNFAVPNGQRDLYLIALSSYAFDIQMTLPDTSGGTYTLIWHKVPLSLIH